MPETEFTASFFTNPNMTASFGSDAVFDLQLPDVVYTAGARIYYDTTENWNAFVDLIPKRGDLYVYSDYEDLDGVQVPNIKIGDGNAFLADLPFVGAAVSARLEAHIGDKGAHITQAEREFWNNKVRCLLGNDDTENIIFTTL